MYETKTEKRIQAKQITISHGFKLGMRYRQLANRRWVDFGSLQSRYGGPLKLRHGLWMRRTWDCTLMSPRFWTTKDVDIAVCLPGPNNVCH